MMFEIQAGNPVPLSSVDEFEDHLEEAIESVFPMDTEDAILNWNGVRVPLSYKYDVSVIAEDLLDLLDAVSSRPQGSHETCFPSNTFRVDWDVRWDERELVCAASWESVSGGVEGVLNASGPVSLPAAEFLSEWKRPLELVSVAVRGAGYQSQAFPQLESLLSRILRPGRLYRGPVAEA